MASMASGDQPHRDETTEINSPELTRSEMLKLRMIREKGLLRTLLKRVVEAVLRSKKRSRGFATANASAPTNGEATRKFISLQEKSGVGPAFTFVYITYRQKKADFASEREMQHILKVVSRVFLWHPGVFKRDVKVEDER